jgi:hypothetical protein
MISNKVIFFGSGRTEKCTFTRGSSDTVFLGMSVAWISYSCMECLCAMISVNQNYLAVKYIFWVVIFPGGGVDSSSWYS